MTDMVDRYIFAVTRKLPEKQREDIEKELRSLIEDMLSARTKGLEASDADVEAVLAELGDPGLLADSYRADKKYLIGPENYDTYFYVLKIVIAAVSFGITLAIAIGYFVNPPQGLVEVVSNYLGSLFGAIFQAFAWVTIVFAIFEYNNVSLRKEFKDQEWSVKDLPQLPANDLIIKPAEAIFGLLFAIIAVTIFNTADHLIGIYSLSEEGATVFVPLFNHVTFRSLLPLLNIMLAIGIVKELIKLATGKWTRTLAYLNLAFNAISFSLFVLFIRNDKLWNDAFFAYLRATGIFPDDVDLLLLWSKVITILIVVTAFAFLLDSMINLVKTLIKDRA
jgi:hypothetical protein